MKFESPFIQILQSVIYMNLNKTIELETLDDQICECIDELALLLDQIYKFPQKQRQHFYDRIQSMKNRLVHLRSHLRETNYNTTQQQYKQIYLNIHNLKTDIHEYGAQNKRKSISPLGSRSMNQHKYQEIMSVMVKKDEQIQLQKNKIYELENTLKTFGKREDTMREQIVLLKKQILELNSMHNKIIDENSILNQQRQSLYQKVMELQSLYNTKNETLIFSTEEVDKLRKSLALEEKSLINKQNLADNLTIELRTLEEKYIFEQRQYKLKQENFKTREKEFKKQIKNLQNQLNSSSAFKEEYFSLQKECTRAKQDKQVLEGSFQLVEQEMERIRRESSKQAKNLTSIIEEKSSTDRLQKEKISKLQENYQKQKQTLRQKNNIIEFNDKEIKMLKEKLFEFEQRNVENQKEFKNWELLFKLKEDELNKLKEEKISATYKFQSLQRDVKLVKQKQNKISVHNKILEENNCEFKKIIEKKEEKQKQMHNLNRQLTIKMEYNQGQFNKVEKQLQKTKKQFLRAKIEAIHEIRQIII